MHLFVCRYSSTCAPIQTRSETKRSIANLSLYKILIESQRFPQNSSEHFSIGSWYIIRCTFGFWARMTGRNEITRSTRVSVLFLLSIGINTIHGSPSLFLQIQTGFLVESLFLNPILFLEGSDSFSRELAGWASGWRENLNPIRWAYVLKFVSVVVCVEE